MCVAVVQTYHELHNAYYGADQSHEGWDYMGVLSVSITISVLGEGAAMSMVR